MVKVNNLPRVAYGRTSGQLVQALVSIISYVSSNLVVGSVKYFGLKLIKKNG